MRRWRSSLLSLPAELSTLERSGLFPDEEALVLARAVEGLSIENNLFLTPSALTNPKADDYIANEGSTRLEVQENSIAKM